MWKSLLTGLLFGIVVGLIMRLPGARFVVPAHAVNLTAMASLWLGAAFAPGQGAFRVSQEALIAFSTYIIVALVFQDSPMWLYAGYVFQGLWCVAHFERRYGVAVLEWFPRFAAMVNIGFMLSLLILEYAL